MLKVIEDSNLLPSAAGQTIPGRYATLFRSLDATCAYGNSKDREDLYQIIQNRDHVINQESKGSGKFYCRKDEIIDLFHDNASNMNYKQALFLAQAQGSIYVVHGDIIFLQTQFVGEIMASLIFARRNAMKTFQ